MPLLPGAEPFHQTGGPVGALVLHGFTGSPVSIRPWADHLAAAGLTVAAPRLPGHGTRWQELNATTWEDWYAEADRNLRWLQDRCDTVVVMGLSMGGSMALRLAERHGDDIDGLVIVNPAVHSERWDRHLLPFLYRIVPAFPGITNDIKKPGMEEGGYDKLPLRAVHSLQQLWTVVKSDILSVTQPLLLLNSADDHVVEPSNAAWIMANVASTDKKQILLENSYHVATLDYDAEEIFASSVEFAQRLAIKV